MDTRKSSPHFTLVAFLVFKSIFLKVPKRIFNDDGTLHDKTLRQQKRFTLQSTTLVRRRYAKVTISAASTSDLRAGITLLRDLLPMGISFSELDHHHCSICFRNHSELQCKACACCTEQTHSFNKCPWLAKLSQDLDEQQPSTSSSVKRGDAEKSEVKRARIFWKHPGQIDSMQVERLVPMESNGRKVITLDTTGTSATGHALSVTIAGWFGSKEGANTLYFNYVKSRDVKQLNSPQTGIQAQQIINGQSLGEVKTAVLFLANQKELLIFAEDEHRELSRLGIEVPDIFKHEIDIINVFGLFGRLPIENLAKFFFPKSKPLQNEPQLGQPSCRKTILTIKLYRRYLELKKRNRQIPGQDVITRSLNCNKNISHLYPDFN